MLLTIRTTIGATVLGFVFALSTSHATNREGFYIGGGAGASQSTIDLIVKNTTNKYIIRPEPEDETDILGNVFLGYGGTNTASFYLAGELNTYLPGRKVTYQNLCGATTNLAIFNNTLEVKDYVTLDLLPGYRLDETWLVYLRAGMSYSNISTSQPAAGPLGVMNADDNKLGGRVGLGFNFAISDNFGVGIDYIYSIYQDFNPLFNTYSTSLEISPSSQYLGLSGIFTF